MPAWASGEELEEQYFNDFFFALTHHTSPPSRMSERDERWEQAQTVLSMTYHHLIFQRMNPFGDGKKGK